MFLFCFFALSLNMQHSWASSPPPVFWEWTTTRPLPKSDDNYPEFLLTSYYSSSFPKVMMPYSRQSPISWLGQSNNLADDSNILQLGRRLQLSKGPRRKRETNFCESVCQFNPRHVCCQHLQRTTQDEEKEIRKKPRANIKLKSKKKVLKTHQTFYLDPIFKIPIVNRSELVVQETPEDETLFSLSDSTGDQTESQKKQIQAWKPYSPNGVIQRRCEVLPSDCLDHQNHPCCIKQEYPNPDRFFPIEPYVQPSLLENWVSALFEHFGKNPASFVIVKHVVLFLLVASLTLIWGFLGSKLGLVHLANSRAQAEKRIDDNEVTEKILLTIQKADDWIKRLEEELAQDPTMKHINKLICCFIPDEQDRPRTQTGGRSTLGRLECEPKKSKPKKSETSIECVSKLLYTVRLNQKIKA